MHHVRSWLPNKSIPCTETIGGFREELIYKEYKSYIYSRIDRRFRSNRNQEHISYKIDVYVFKRIFTRHVSTL